MSASNESGYSGKPLWQKLGIKPGMPVRVENAPMDYASLVGLDPGEFVMVGPAAAFDLIHLFCRDAAELQQRLPALSGLLPATAMLWISWPKKSSTVATDISEDTIRQLALPLGLVDVKVCAVDATWSGLKLVWRRDRRKTACG